MIYIYVVRVFSTVLLLLALLPATTLLGCRCECEMRCDASRGRNIRLWLCFVFAMIINREQMSDVKRKYYGPILPLKYASGQADILTCKTHKTLFWLPNPNFPLGIFNGFLISRRASIVTVLYCNVQCCNVQHRDRIPTGSILLCLPWND